MLSDIYSITAYLLYTNAANAKTHALSGNKIIGVMFWGWIIHI